MKDIVLLEFSCEGKKHTFPFPLSHYIGHVNSLTACIEKEPTRESYKVHGRVISPSVNDSLHVRIAWNGFKNGNADGVYSVVQCEERHIEEELLPKLHDETITGSLMHLGAHYCILRKEAELPENSNPIIIGNDDP